MTPVAVLGAGFQGVCAALELAARGVDVDLYDRRSACITEAGCHNEGKIHLGFVYSLDASFDTARLLARGALTFDTALSRWLDGEVTKFGTSSPHFYVVHRDSLLPPDAVLAHFARVRDFVHELGRARPYTYLGQDARTIAFHPEDVGTVFDPELTAALIRTDERSVDVTRLAERLRDRVASEPRITFHSNTEVTCAGRGHGTISLSLRREGVGSTRQYGQVVNCLWAGKLAIDRAMQFLPGYRSLYRAKYGVTVVFREPNCSVPSTTVVVGPFGDIVQFDERRLYLTWYPVGRRGASNALTPPDWPTELAGDEAERLIGATLEACGRLVNPVRALHRGLFEKTSVAGGVILAAGETDIDDPHSRLHTRTAVGVRSIDGYHSVDTGKYTLAPMYAIEVADRISGIRRPMRP